MKNISLFEVNLKIWVKVISALQDMDYLHGTHLPEIAGRFELK